MSLNSDGGSFPEGLMLARLFNKRLVTTLVKRDARCLSACALAFMGGATSGAHGSMLLSRAVEVGGRLGFHAPFLQVGPKEYNERAVEAAYAKAVASIADMIRLADDVNFSTEVLPEILERGQAELKELITVDDFARFEVALLPIPSINKVTKSMVKHACRNGFVYEQSRKPDWSQYLLRILDTPNAETSTYTHQLSNFFVLNEVTATRAVMAIAEGDEASFYWCLFDIAIVEGKIKTACRGL